MGEVKLMQLVQDLEQLGSEMRFFGCGDSPEVSDFLNKQRQVVSTADKIQRELASEIRFNPTRLMGIAYPFEDELESVTGLLTGLEDIKQAALHAVDELPAKTRHFARLVENHLADGSAP
jgi:hypothetical protein